MEIALVSLLLRLGKVTLQGMAKPWRMEEACLHKAPVVSLRLTELLCSKTVREILSVYVAHLSIMPHCRLVSRCCVLLFYNVDMRQRCILPFQP